MNSVNIEIREALDDDFSWIEEVMQHILKGKEKNLKRIWALKKEIAQVLTLIKEKELLERNNPQAKLEK